jgi:excisionase family DNA binding protein
MSRPGIPWTHIERNDVSLPQRSPAPALPRPAAYGQRPYGRPTLPGPAPIGHRPPAVRPAPAPRAAVSFLTVVEVAAIMRVSKMTVYRLVHGGELAAVRVGRSFRVPETAVREYLAGARTDVV